MIEKNLSTGSEWLIIEGLIGPDEKFSLLSSRSQQRVSAHKPKGAKKTSEFSLLLLNEEQESL